VCSFHLGSVARIPGLKSETWGTLRFVADAANWVIALLTHPTEFVGRDDKGQDGASIGFGLHGSKSQKRDLGHPSIADYTAWPYRQGQWKGLRPCLFRPTYPEFLHEAPPTSTRAAFIKESRMKFTDASKLDRKSGVRWGERGAPVPFL